MPDNLPRIILSAGRNRIQARVARTDSDRTAGLMHCASLQPDEGMLFIHDEPVNTCFWMKNTPLDLSVAFVDDSGRIVQVEEMAAQSLEGVCAAEPVRYVLEMNSGWFTQCGITAGATIEGLPLYPAAAAMNLVQLLLPVYDNAGQPLPRGHYEAVRRELVERFGGLTAYTRAPAKGLWSEDGDALVKDDIVVYEVMARELDRAWWKDYRRRLEARFAQEELVIRALGVEVL